MLSFWSCHDWKYFVNVRVGAWNSGTPLDCFACESSANEATREQAAEQPGAVALPRRAPCFNAPSRKGGGTSCVIVNKLATLNSSFCAPVILGSVHRGGGFMLGGGVVVTPSQPDSQGRRVEGSLGQGPCVDGRTYLLHPDFVGAGRDDKSKASGRATWGLRLWQKVCWLCEGF